MISFLTGGRGQSRFPWAVAALTALGAAVVKEPAPYDLFWVVLAAVALLGRTFRFDRTILAPAAALGLFLLANALGIPAAQDLTRAIWYAAVTAYLALTLLFFVGVFGRFGQPAVTLAGFGYIGAAGVSAVIGTLGLMDLIPWAERFVWDDRAAALFKDPNVLGAFLIPGALLALSAASQGVGRARQLLIFVAGIIGTGVALSMSRGAWGGVVLSVGLWVAVPGGPARRDRLRLAAGAFVVAVLVLLAALRDPDVLAAFLSRLRLWQPYDADRFKFQWLALSLARPWFGLGPGQAEVVLHYATHNLFIRILVENGVVGLLGFVSLVALTLRRSWVQLRDPDHRIWAYHAVAVAGVAGLLLNSLVIDSLHWRHLWFLLALGWIRTERGQIRTEDPRKRGVALT